MLLAGTLLAFANQKTDGHESTPLMALRWTELLSSIYNEEKFEKLVNRVDKSAHNFELMSPSPSNAKHHITFLPQVHFIDSFEPILSKLSTQYQQENGSDFGDFLHKRIAAAAPLELNALARILEVYNSQLAIYDQLSNSVESLADGKTINIFVESLQYSQKTNLGFPTKNNMGPFLIRNGAAELIKALYPKKVRLVGTELMDMVALDDEAVANPVTSIIDSNENLSELYLNCLERFKAEKIRYESKCYRLLIMRQREANAVAVIKAHLQEKINSQNFLIYGAAHPMPLYSDEILRIDYPEIHPGNTRNPLLARNLKALNVLNKLLFEQSLVFRDFKNTQRFTLLLAQELLKNRSKSDEFSSKQNPFSAF